MLLALGAPRALRLTARLFGRYAGRDAALQQQQKLLVHAFALPSPTMALRETSMTLAEIDLHAHLHFLRHAGHDRYTLAQHLNQLQVDAG